MNTSPETIFATSLSDRDFGPIADGPEKGLVVLFEGGFIRDVATGDTFRVSPVPGVVVGYHDDCAIIQVEGAGFLGRVARNQYRVLNLVIPDKGYLN